MNCRYGGSRRVDKHRTSLVVDYRPTGCREMVGVAAVTTDRLSVGLNRSNWNCCIKMAVDSDWSLDKQLAHMADSCSRAHMLSDSHKIVDGIVIVQRETATDCRTIDLE